MWEQSIALNLEPVELHQLRTLVLGDFGLQYALYVLKNISAPFVRDLTLMNMNNEDYSPLAAAMTSAFKDVRLLTLYTFEVDDSPSIRTICVKWLGSMPQLRYLKLAQVKASVVDAFHQVSHEDQDPCGSIPSATVPNPNLTTPQVLCPRLDVLEYQMISTDIIVSFVLGRQALGVLCERYM